MTEPTLHVARDFDDFDEFQESIRAWDLDFRQLDAGPFSGSMLQFGARDSLVSCGRFDRALEQKGAPPADTFTFAVPTSRCTPFLWRGHRMAPGKIALFEPGSELDAVSAGGFEIITMSVTGDALSRAARRRGLPLETVTRAGTTTIPRDRIAEFERRVSGALRGTEEDLLAALIDGLAEGRGDDEVRAGRLRRNALMARVDAFLSARPREPVTVGDLCSALSVNERTLRRSFRERYGMSPKACLTALRLSGARRELIAAAPATARVADIARSWGFPHPGPFAVRYREQFGEPPSATLRRRT